MPCRNWGSVASCAWKILFMRLPIWVLILRRLPVFYGPSLSTSLKEACRRLNGYSKTGERRVIEKISSTN